MQTVTRSEHTSHGKFHPEPADTPMPTTPLGELLMEAGFIGAVVLALVLIVISSVGP